MAVFGQYETVAELGRNSSTCVFRARPADGGWDLGFDDLGSDANFAIKTFHVRNAEDAGGSETGRFLERVRAQKRIAAASALHWVPVLDTGTAGGNAYCVMPYYPRSAAKLAHAQGGINADTLHAIVIGTLQGLLELRRTQRRPHGNLKSTNILIKAGGRIAPTDVHLTDLAREEDATIAGEVEDLYNLGEVIHELVLGTKFAGQHVWPIPPSREWSHLGKKATQWLALCNHLLSPRAAENWLRVDDILDDVEPLRPRRKPMRSRKLWVALAALTVVSGLGVGEYFRYAGQWRELCADSVDGVGALSSQLARNTPREIAADAYLQERVVRALAEARDRNVKLDPCAIAGLDQSPEALADHPPMSFRAVWKTEKAWRVVRAVDRSLAPDQWKDLADLAARRTEYEKRGWPKLAQYTATVADQAKRPAQGEWVMGIAGALEGHARLAKLDTARQAARSRMEHLTARAKAAPAPQEALSEFETLLRASVDADSILPSAVAADRLTEQLVEAEQLAAKFDDAVPLLAETAKRQRAYEVRGWTAPARSLSLLIDRAHPSGDLTSLGVDLAIAKRGWEQVENVWTQIEQRRRVLETSGDRILATYRQFVEKSNLSDQPDLPSLARRLEELNDEPAWAAAAKKVASPEWAKVDIVEFAQKSDAHRGFTGKSVATPQIVRLWLSEVEGYGAQLASATIKPDSAHSSGTGNEGRVVTVPRLPTTIATVPLNSLVAITPTTSPTAIKPPTTISVAVTKPAPDPEHLRIEREIAGYITECREVALTAKSQELKTLWRSRNDEFAERLEKDHKIFTPAFKAQRDIFRSRLLQLDSADQSTAAPLALKPGPAAWSRPLVQALQAAAPQRSLKELGALAASDDGRFESAMAAMVDADEQWRASAARLLADAARVDQLLSQGYLPGDKASGMPQALSSVRSSDLYKTDTVRQALDPLIKPVALVESESAPPALRLLAASADLPLGVRLAAWSKVGDDATHETLRTDLKLAGALLADLRTRATDKSRVDSIKTRLEADLRHRWESLLDRPAREQDIDAAIAMRDQISGVDIDRLAPRGRFNFALHDFRTVIAAARGDDVEKQIAPAAQKLKQLIAGLDPAQAKTPPIVALTAEMDRLSHPAPIDFARLGPMSEAAAQATAGKITWSAAAEDGGDKVTYRASLPTDAGKEDVSLVFRRVHPSSSSGSSWVCTSETSLGIFCDLITISGKWADIRAAKLLADYDPMRGDPRLGPRTWEWPRYGRSGDIIWTRVWLSGDFIPPGLDHYPIEIAGEYNENRTQIGSPATHARAPELNPSRRQPMQHVSAKAAILAAGVAGCRLPTIVEWQAANKSAEQRAASNLRDRTWRIELEHMNKPAFNGRCRPDAGMFVPADEKPSDAVYPRADGGDLNDGVLWFREVPAAAPNFVDLVGNVGEFVSDDAGKLYVIGGSALSPPTRAVDRPFALGADQAASGFSDVGFRLAFAGPPSGIDKLKDIVAGNWYLTAKP